MQFVIIYHIFLIPNHEVEGALCLIYNQKHVTIPPPTSVLGGSGATFGPGYASVHKAASCWRSVAPKVLHNPLRDGPKCPKGLQKLAFRPLWATLLEQIGEGAVFEKNILFIMLPSPRATPELSIR